MTAVMVLTWVFIAASLIVNAITLHDLRKQRIYRQAAQWYATHYADDPKPKDVLTFERKRLRR